MTVVFTQQPQDSTVRFGKDHQFSVQAATDLRILDADYDGGSLNSFGSIASFTTTPTTLATKFSSSSIEFAADASKRITLSGDYFNKDVNEQNAVWSFEAWIYPTNIGTNSLPIIYSSQASATSGNYWYLEINTSGNLQIRSRNQQDGVVNTFTGTTALSADTWYYVAVYADAGNHWVFLDGVPETNLINIRMDYPYIGSATPFTYIGTDSSLGFNGYMDDLRYVFNSQAFSYSGSGNIAVPTSKLPDDQFLDPSDPMTYEWFVNDLPQPESNSATFTLTATLQNSYSRVYAKAVNSYASTSESDTAFAITAVGSNLTKHALLWNYKNDTFSWKDPATEQEDNGSFELFNVDFQSFGFVPGFQQRWNDYKETAFLESTWTDAADLPWLETFSKGKDKEMLVVSNGQLLRAEAARNRAGSKKLYFAERTQIDFDGLSPEFRSGNVKQTKRFVMDVQGDQKQVSRGSVNKVDFYVGWSMNLMEDPKYKGPITFDLQARDFGGSYKVDYRSSGRYMGMFFDMTEASQLSFTGGEVEVAQTSGR